MGGVIWVGGGEHGDDGEDPPVPGEAVDEDADDDDGVFEGKDEAGDRVPGLRVAHSGDGFEVDEHEGFGALELDGCCAAFIAAEFFSVGGIGAGGHGHAGEHMVSRIERFRHEG